MSPARKILELDAAILSQETLKRGIEEQAKKALRRVDLRIESLVAMKDIAIKCVREDQGSKNIGADFSNLTDGAPTGAVQELHLKSYEDGEDALVGPEDIESFFV